MRTLFRMIGRQPPESRAFLASKEFAREVQICLATDAGLSSSDLALAVLASLGDRVDEARHLALHLLHVHFRPSLEALESVRRKALASDRQHGARTAGRRSRDAALLLAQRCADQRVYERVLLAISDAGPELTDPSSPLDDSTHADEIKPTARRILRKAVHDAARDSSDPRIRLRALAAASRWEEPGLKRQLRRELRQLLQQDASPMVRRALERVFPPQVEERQRRLSQPVR